MSRDSDEQSATYPMRVVTRMTGLSAERLRAWETRHRAVSPARTDGGSRRYSESDVERLRLLRRATDRGHRIGELVPLDLDALRTKAADEHEDAPAGRLEEMIHAVDHLDAVRLRALLEARLAEVGPEAFATDEVLPLAYEIGQRWAAGETSVAAEHRATNVFRSILVDLVEVPPEDELGPRIVFAAPENERHDLGVLAAAISSRGFGARPLFVGADVPIDDVVSVAIEARADVLALGFVVSTPTEIDSSLRAIRRALPDPIALWIGGQAIVGCPPIRGVDRIEGGRRLEAFVLEARSREDRGR